MSKMGRPSRFEPAVFETLREITAANPMATLDELTAKIAEQTGIHAHSATVRKALREAGVRRARPEIQPASTAPAKRYGDTDQHRAQAPEQRYPSSLTDAEWALVADLFERAGKQGLPPKESRRSMVEACCYVVRTGCSWRQLPKEFPPWANVYRTFRRWADQGKFEAMHDRLRALWRERAGRSAEPTAAVLDAQSTRRSPQGGPAGYDAGKKVKGRKRNLIVDTLGLLLAVTVTPANVQDRDASDGAVADAMRKYPTVETLFVDGGYAGQCARRLCQQHGLAVEVVHHPANKNGGRWVGPEQEELFPVPAKADGFVPLPKRWVVERSHGWNERSRRLIMHHDRLPTVSETWVWLASARGLLSRLTA
ncbi:MAG: IS5 family transposase [Chloroflexota bacterium]